MYNVCAVLGPSQHPYFRHREIHSIWADRTHVRDEHEHRIMFTPFTAGTQMAFRLLSSLRYASFTDSYVSNVARCLYRACNRAMGSVPFGQLTRRWSGGGAWQAVVGGVYGWCRLLVGAFVDEY